MEPTTLRAIRLHLTDLGPDYLLSDQDLKALYTDSGQSVARTVASGLRTIAASELLVSKKISTQDLTTDGPAISAELRALAREWDAKADAEQEVEPSAFSGFIGGAPATRREGVEYRW